MSSVSLVSKTYLGIFAQFIIGGAGELATSSFGELRDVSRLSC